MLLRWWNRWHKTRARIPFVIKHGHANKSLGGMRHICHIGRLQIGSNDLFPFVSTILKPNFYLGLGQAQWSRQSCTLRWTQISRNRNQANNEHGVFYYALLNQFKWQNLLFHIKSRFELKDLGTRKNRSGFFISFALHCLTVAIHRSFHGFVVIIIIVDWFIDVIIGFMRRIKLLVGWWGCGCGFWWTGYRWWPLIGRLKLCNFIKIKQLTLNG